MPQTRPTLVQPLPDGPLDIVGDVHSELSALLTLLVHLGYNSQGRHPENRKLVFVGDLCDRGPDSVGVIQVVQLLVEQGNAQVILGNHELNLLIGDAKDGSGWFFDEREESDLNFYAPFRRTPRDQRAALTDFLAQQPIALERDDIRVVHAAWTTPAIEAIRTIPAGQVVEQYAIWDHIAKSSAEESGLYERYQDEKRQWARELEDGGVEPPMLHAIAEYEAMQQMINPLKILTSGVEKKAATPFFAGNRWRFSDRVSWWDTYGDVQPVVIGHYWRLLRPELFANTARYSQLFDTIDPISWHGRHHNVFCVDYSVGARWRDRKADRGTAESRFKLAALQWPENRLVFDSGETAMARP